MAVIDKIEEKQLKLTAVEEGDTIKVVWEGKSNDRNPSIYLAPFFDKIIEIITQSNQKIEMDFTRLQYMNSSTITPVVQLLDKAREQGYSISLLYDKSKSWQEISFSAMSIFESNDPVIKVVPV